MRYNPCGAIVDWSRAPYTQECRFFRDSDATSTVRWFEAEPDAKTLTFPSAICVSTNEQDRYLDSPIGEVYGARHKFKLGKAPNGLYDGHYCGTEQDFQEGCKYDPDSPEFQYLANGFPVCCGAPFTALGGAGAGGIARLVVDNPVVPGNTCATAANAALNTTYSGTAFAGTQYWYRFTLPAPGTYYLTVNFTSGALRAIDSWRGPNCAGIIHVQNFTGSFTRFTLTTTSAFCWLVPFSVLSNFSYTLKVEDH